MYTDMVKYPQEETKPKYFYIKNDKEDMKMKSVLNINRENFEREVMESKQPVLLDFYASWCGPCRMVAPAMEEIANEREDIKVGKVDIEDQKELADKFGVLSVPALVVMKDGKIINRAIGARPKEDILSLVV